MHTQSSRFVWLPGQFFDILLVWYKGVSSSPSLVFLPFLPVNQTGVKRRLISLLSGWQCLGDRALVANWMVLGSFSSCINPSDISFTLKPLPPLSSPLFLSVFLLSSLQLLPPFAFLPSLSPADPCHSSDSFLPDLSLHSPLCSPCASLLSIERRRATRGNSLVRCSQVNWLPQRKGLKRKKWIRRTPTLSREKRESTCVFLTLAAPLSSDAAAVRPDVILSHWLSARPC